MVAQWRPCRWGPLSDLYGIPPAWIGNGPGIHAEVANDHATMRVSASPPARPGPRRPAQRSASYRPAAAKISPFTHKAQFLGPVNPARVGSREWPCDRSQAAGTLLSMLPQIRWPLMEGTAAPAKSVPPVDRQTKKKGADLGRARSLSAICKKCAGAMQKLACTFGA